MVITYQTLRGLAMGALSLLVRCRRVRHFHKKVSLQTNKIPLALFLDRNILGLLLFLIMFNSAPDPTTTRALHSDVIVELQVVDGAHCMSMHTAM
jgi:hypothetical protein